MPAQSEQGSLPKTVAATICQPIYMIEPYFILNGLRLSSRRMFGLDLEIKDQISIILRSKLVWTEIRLYARLEQNNKCVY